MPSSVIAHMKYDKESQTLRIIFVSGAVYDYLNVTGKTFDAMRSAGSKGVYLNKNIKTKYPFKKIK